MTPWWRGQRGEWYAALQLALVLMVVFGPATLAGLPKWPGTTTLRRTAGTALMVCGALVGIAALKRLRGSVSATGSLKSAGALVTTGPYRFVRHPVYCGLILPTLGWSLAGGSRRCTRLPWLFSWTRSQREKSVA